MLSNSSNERHQDSQKSPISQNNIKQIEKAKEITESLISKTEYGGKLNKQDLQDISQEVLVKFLYLDLNKVHNLGGYIRTIITGLLNKHFRSYYKEPSLGSGNDFSTYVADIQPSVILDSVNEKTEQKSEGSLSSNELEIGYLTTENELGKAPTIIEDKQTETEMYLSLKKLPKELELIYWCFLVFYDNEKTPTKNTTKVRNALNWSRATFYRKLRVFRTTLEEKDTPIILKDPLNFYINSDNKYWSDTWKKNISILRECIREQVHIAYHFNFWLPYYRIGFLLMRMGEYYLASSVFELLIQIVKENKAIDPPEELKTIKSKLQHGLIVRPKKSILADCLVEQSAAFIYMFFQTKAKIKKECSLELNKESLSDYVKLAEEQKERSFNYIKLAEEQNSDDEVVVAYKLRMYNWLKNSLDAEKLCNTHQKNSDIIDYIKEEIKRSDDIDLNKEEENWKSQKISYHEIKQRSEVLRLRKKWGQMEYLKKFDWFINYLNSNNNEK